MSIAVGIAAVLALVLGYHWVRTSMLRRWCERRDLTFVPYPAPHEPSELGPLGDLCAPHAVRRWGAAITGDWEGSRLRLQEQELKPRVSANVVRHTLVVWTVPGLDLPRFRLAAAAPRALGREGPLPVLLRRMTGSLPPAGPDQDAAQDGFAARYELTGDPARLAAVFTPAVREALAARPMSGVLAGSGSTIVWRGSGLLQPWRIDAMLEEAVRLKAILAAGLEAPMANAPPGPALRPAPRAPRSLREPSGVRPPASRE